MLYQTHARVHLGNIRRNLEGIRAQVGPDRKVLIAVKANAYGHGAVEVSRMAERLGLADGLGVATVPEGLELREAGLKLPILKFSPAFPEEMAAAVSAGIALAVCERPNIEALQAVAAGLGRKALVHLKIDTGMGRIGVTPGEAPALALFIERQCPDLLLEGVMTHLPVSDEEGGIAYTRDEIALFRGTVATLAAAIGRMPELVHASNSGAVLGHEDAWLSMVRPGIMIYGHYPDATTPRTIPLHPGMSLLTRLAFVKKVAAGTSIGYGRTWVAPQDTWIGTLPAGYADGFNRLFSNRGRALVRGRSCPVVGRVCMDQCMIDLGPDAGAAPGDEVVLMGRSGAEEITAQEWADVLGTITYEVTCQINARVERVFDAETV
ncbi:alanine racemase [Mesoterricola silvestris]|uniref:Alanine racemase n=1 Tax=Mesoterricola silvestris TaxID=2927979 RepID=A0AA48GIX2_9BACT|nr:alanine racemase [Mesoterricola silvestris]BDU71904.1 alanine racemase [Mesoterricola silvestris]